MAKATPKTVAGKARKGVKRFAAKDELAFAHVIEIADRAYGDDQIGGYYRGDCTSGDTLADFVVRELRDVFDPKADHEANLREARRAMESAVKQLRNVEGALHRAIVQLMNQKPLVKKTVRKQVDKRRQVR